MSRKYNELEDDFYAYVEYGYTVLDAIAEGNGSFDELKLPKKEMARLCVKFGNHLGKVSENSEEYEDTKNMKEITFIFCGVYTYLLTHPTKNNVITALAFFGDFLYR